jgi:hypothetical protein
MSSQTTLGILGGAQVTKTMMPSGVEQKARTTIGTGNSPVTKTMTPSGVEQLNGVKLGDAGITVTKTMMPSGVEQLTLKLNVSVRRSTLGEFRERWGL